MNFKLSFTGLKEIDEILRGLPNEVNHRIMGAAHADAAKPLIEVAQSKIKNKTGNLKKSIGPEKISIQKSNSIGAVVVGPRRRRGYRGFHGHLVEYGHRKGGWNKKRNVPDYPFMQPAFDQTKDKIVQQVQILN